VRIRPARGDDFERVASLLELLGRPALDHRTHDDLKIMYEQQVVDPHAHHIVAEDDDGRVAGFLSLHFRVRLNCITPEAWVADLFVLEGVRNRGVGRMLLDEAERRARERDCHALVVEAGYKQAEAHQLFRSAGMRDLGKHFGKRLV
jgi:GNAT superfamily N-acetyltransferase